MKYLLAIILSIASAAVGQISSGSYEAFKLKYRKPQQVIVPVKGPQLKGAPKIGDTGRLPYGKFWVKSVLSTNSVSGYYQWGAGSSIQQQKAVLAGVPTEGIADGYPIEFPGMLVVSGTRKVESLVGEHTLIEIKPADQP